MKIEKSSVARMVKVHFACSDGVGVCAIVEEKKSVKKSISEKSIQKKINFCCCRTRTPE